VRVKAHKIQTLNRFVQGGVFFADETSGCVHRFVATSLTKNTNLSRDLQGMLPSNMNWVQEQEQEQKGKRDSIRCLPEAFASGFLSPRIWREGKRKARN
jgi:hypothetical protein